MMKKILLAAAVMMVVIATAGGALAGSIAPQINVTGTVTGTCTIVTSPGDMAFTIDPSAGGPFTAAVGTQPVIKCTKNHPYTIGCTSLNTFNLKQGTTDLIPYSFSCPSGGNGGGFGTTGGITLTIGGQVSTDYVDAPAGAYADTVTITVSY
jgi:spore coat protein U-like protein